MAPSRRSPRRIAPASLAALAALVLLPWGAGVAAAAEPAEPTAQELLSAKAERKLLEQLDEKDKTIFWVVMKKEADLSAAESAESRTAKAEAVLRAKKKVAQDTQSGVLEAAGAAGADAVPYWIDNSVKVVGDIELATKIAALPEVGTIEADRAVKLDQPADGSSEPTVDGVEWGVDRINAPQVWSTYGVRGEGVVVANIDSGVQYDHPALAKQYRGRNADGSFSHDYNWFDPAGVCTGDNPCDNNGHGTHTMGTMVGDDGNDNRIGVAPGATWIAAKGCESSSCSRASLLASGQWMVAPTDANGANPRPDLAPDIVNNSWGSSVQDPWYQDVVTSWRAAGIFPAFSNGNSGPGCNTAGSPGSYVSSYASGAFDSGNAIASFSSRGTGENGTVKPNLAAPGVNVRSAYTGGGYSSLSGTSMASPHTAGAVALVWSASASLRGDVPATEALLDDTAIDVSALTCGGTADDNNVFGEGRLDAHAAVSGAPRGATGSLTGTVTVAGDAVAGAQVVADGPIDRTVVTDAEGGYRFPALSVGDYDLTVKKFGHADATGTATVEDGRNTVRDFSLVAAPSAKVSGTVTSSAGPAGGAELSFAGTPVTATADARGRYEATLPHGSYTLNATHESRCVTPGSAEVSVSGDTVADVRLPDRLDTFGTACTTGTGSWVPGTDKLNLSGDSGNVKIDLPFPVPFYGKTYRSAWVSTNGYLNFLTANSSNSNSALPGTAAPNAALYPFWDDLLVRAGAGGVYTAVRGEYPDRTLVVEWRDVVSWYDQGAPFSFSAEIGEDGSVTYRYKDVADTSGGYSTGRSATVGVENATGTDALQYSFNSEVISDGLSVAFRATKSGVVLGTVTDGNDDGPVSGVEVAAGPASTMTDSDGRYALQLGAGTHALAFSATGYTGEEKAVVVEAGRAADASASLATGRVALDQKQVTAVAPADQTRERSATLTNTGSATPYTITEAVDGTARDVPWLTVSPVRGDLAKGASQTVRLGFDTTGHKPGDVLSADLLVRSDSGRSPELKIPVKLVVPGYQQSLDSGAGSSSTDARGDSWQPDRAYEAGSFGYLGTTKTTSTKQEIGGTQDPRRFTTAREGMHEYRFDNVPNGVYTVELDFAELSSTKPTARVFDVIAEGKEVESSLDVALEAGTYTALQRAYTVTVTDGVLNVRFVANSGKTLVNALRVTERPDLS
ncbi:S8 family serine peptidase [Streptomyces sp. NPDC059637]|uniref:S8 family serine peptidase n=1 Tax=Streptomyces sp. NPDC059637 TaxID=3347752 RepID=UPI0036C93D1F